LGDNGSYRVATVAAPGPDTTSRYLVYVGLPMAPMTSSVTQLAAALGVGVPVLAAILALITWTLVGRALLPVEVLRRQAAEITVTDLHRRVDVPPSHDEMSRLALTLNQLLGSVDNALSQQRRFVADAAHELRSPIASLLAQLEVPGSGDDRLTAQELIPDVRRLAHLVDDLLTLARVDAEHEPPDVTVDLDDVVLTEIDRMRSNAVSVGLDASGVNAARVRGDAGMMSRVVRNLLDNAVRYARSRVVIGLRSEACEVLLTVADDGPGIGAEQRGIVFERFTRLDDARDRDAGGAGLGLAIVREIAASHGGVVTVEDNQPGARLIVRLPSAGRTG
jgi:signal transduction histidine kinase